MGVLLNREIVDNIDVIIKKKSKELNIERFILFGMGEYGECFLKLTSIIEEYDYIIVDSKCTSNEKYNIYNPNQIEFTNKDMVLIVTIKGEMEIAKELLLLHNNVNWISIPYVEYYIRTQDRIKNYTIKSCMIEASSLCNAKCKFCAHPTMNRKKTNMNKEVFEKIIFRLLEGGFCPEKFWLHLLGEPLLDKELFSKVRRLKKEFPFSSVGFATNFNCANRLMIDEIFESGLDFIVISLNAIEQKEYNRIMNLDYNRTLSNIDNLIFERGKRKSDLDIELSIVEEKDEESIKRFREIWDNKNVKIRVMKKGEWIRKKEESFEYKGDIFLKKTTHYICNMLIEELTVFSNGKYALCCFDGEGKYDLGDVFSTSIKEMRESKIINDLLVRMMQGYSINFCDGCSFYI